MEDDEREAGTRAQAAPSYAVCASCEEHWAQLYFCNVCRYVFCSKCWELQLAHRKKSLAPGAIPHEKTDLELAQRIHDVFTTDFDDTAFEKLHAEDQATAWFGKLHRISSVHLRIYVLICHPKVSELEDTSLKTCFSVTIKDTPVLCATRMYALHAK